jgi:hypothetical protein
MSDLDLPKTVLELNDFEKTEIMNVFDLADPKVPRPTTTAMIIPDTTDVNLLFEAVKNYRVIESFLGPIQRASLTAAIDALPGARLCSPTNKVLFTRNVAADLKMPDQCVPYKTKKISANVVLMPNGDEYFWVEDISASLGVRIFDGSHKEIVRSNPMYMTIIGMINSQDIDSLLDSI